MHLSDPSFPIDFGANLPLLIIGLAEILACIWFFGIDNWFKELQFMIGPKEKGTKFDTLSRYYFYYCWNYISPVLLIIVFIGYLYTTVTQTLTYDAWSATEAKITEEDYTGVSLVLIVVLQALPCAIIPIWAVYRYFVPDPKAVGENEPLIDWGKAWVNVKSVFSHNAAETI